MYPGIRRPPSDCRKVLRDARVRPCQQQVPAQRRFPRTLPDPTSTDGTAPDDTVRPDVSSRSCRWERSQRPASTRCPLSAPHDRPRWSASYPSVIPRARFLACHPRLRRGSPPPLPSGSRAAGGQPAPHMASGPTRIYINDHPHCGRVRTSVWQGGAHIWTCLGSMRSVIDEKE